MEQQRQQQPSRARATFDYGQEQQQEEPDMTQQVQQQPQQPQRQQPQRQQQQQKEEESDMMQQQQQYGTFDPGMDIPMEQQQQQPQRRAPAASVTISTTGSGSGGSRKPGGGSSRGGGPPYVQLQEQQQQSGVDEESYRAWLTVTFKHHFEPFEPQGGMLIEDFDALIKQYENELGRKYKLKCLFKQLDKDGNRRVSWNEFYNGMKYTKKTEVKKSEKVVNKVIKKLTPAAKRKVRETKKEAANEGEPIPEESYLEAYNCRPPPIFMPLLFVIIWIFFIIYAVELNRGPDWNHVSWESGLPYYSPLVFCPSVRQQAWRFISYMLLHDGYHHIVFNTVLGLILGVPLETVHKIWRVGPVFLIGVFAGALASSIIDPKTAMVGASGGVYSLIGAHYATVLMNWEELQSDWLKCRSNPLKFLLSGVMTLVYLTLFVGVDFGVAAYRRYALTLKVPMSVSAHVGGMLAGLLVGTPVLRNIDKKPWEGVVSIVAIVAASVLILFGILWNIFYHGYPNSEDVACSNPSIVD